MLVLVRYLQEKKKEEVDQFLYNVILYNYINSDPLLSYKCLISFLEKKWKDYSYRWVD